MDSRHKFHIPKTSIYFKLTKLVKELLIYSFGGVLNRSIGFFLIPLYTTFLTVEEYGVLAILGIILQLISFVGLLGISTAAIRFFHENEATIEYRKEVYGNALTVLLIWPFLLMFIVMLLIDVFSIKQVSGIKIFPLIFWVLIIGVLSPVSRLLIGLFRSRRKSYSFVIFNAAFFLLQALLIIYFVALKKMGVNGQVQGQLIANLVFFCIAVLILFRFGKVQFNPKIIRKLMMFGIPLVPFFVFGWVNNSASRIFIERHIDLKSVGLFFLAAQFAGILTLINNSLNYALAPNFYREANQEMGPQVNGELVFRFLVGFLFLATVIVAIAPYIIIFVADSTYHESTKYITPLVIVALLHAFSSPVNWVLTYMKKTAILSRIQIVTAIFLLLILFVLTWQNKISISTVIGAILLANSLMLVLGYLSSKKHYALKIEARKVVMALMVFAVIGSATYSAQQLLELKVAIPVLMILMGFSGFASLRLVGSGLQFQRATKIE